MRLKTFLATYLLFLFILFSILAFVSVYMSTSQMSVLKEKGVTEYQTIAASLAKDIAVLSGRSKNLSEDVNTLVNGYSKYYKKNNIAIELIDLSLTAQENDDDNKVSFVTHEQEHFIFVTGPLPEPFSYYRLDYYYNISNGITDMRNIQNVLLAVCAAFSMITAFALYFILTGIFRPLSIVAKTSREIAGGRYNERIHIKGKNELSAMARDFNRMATEMEKQIRLLEEEAVQKQQFVDNFAHEIRTPLTSIYGYAEYLQKASLDEKETIESAQFIMDEASHMKRIANSLLELATLRHYMPVKNELSIPKLFEDIRQAMKKSLHEQKIRLVCRPDADVLEGQEDLIKSLLLNLCFNALKACSPNDGVVCLEAKKQGENTILSVSDNGCGIPEESISKVTEPFYRADKARSRETGGVGLGLALCKQIAEVHGAEMTVESPIGTGTTIKIVFTTS